MACARALASAGRRRQGCLSCVAACDSDQAACPLSAAATTGSFSSKSGTASTAAATGQVVLGQSPAAKSPATARLTLTSVTLAGYQWNATLSDTPKDFSW